MPRDSLSVHSVFANTTKLRAAAGRKAEPPPVGLLPRGERPEGGERVRRVKLWFTPGNVIKYKWRRGGWRRYEGGSRFEAKSGEQIAPPNLVVQEVRVDDSKEIVDTSGNPSPDIKLKGSGEAVLFRNGRAFPGRWTIEETGEAPVYETTEGEEFRFDEGPVWVELVPSRKGDVKGRFSFR